MTNWRIASEEISVVSPGTGISSGRSGDWGSAT